jgi:membrane protein YqaA with SNARE-associated domain
VPKPVISALSRPFNPWLFKRKGNSHYPSLLGNGKVLDFNGLAEFMRLFSKFYHRVLHWANHRHAPYYLALLSFAESSVFPIPPDVMLAPLILAKPEQAWRNAALTTLASVLGGLFGYVIGMCFFEVIAPWIVRLGYEPAYQQAILWFKHWGFLAVFIAGFTPVPYKVFTIAAGVVLMPVLPFIIASVIGRGGRFFMVTALLRWRGKRIEHLLLRYIDRIGWYMLLLILLAFTCYYYLSIKA